MKQKAIMSKEICYSDVSVCLSPFFHSGQLAKKKKKKKKNRSVTHLWNGVVWGD